MGFPAIARKVYLQKRPTVGGRALQLCLKYFTRLAYCYGSLPSVARYLSASSVNVFQIYKVKHDKSHVLRLFFMLYNINNTTARQLLR